MEGQGFNFMDSESTFSRQGNFLDAKSDSDCVEVNQKIKTALLLAAGMGHRPRPITDDAPKCLTEVGGVSILKRLVRCLKLNGVERLIVVVGHMQDSIRHFFETSSTGLNVEYVFNPDYLTTNNIYSL